MPAQPILLNPVRTEWHCPGKNCEARAVTVTTKIPMHPCPVVGGLMVPLVRVGERANVTRVEREDMSGGDLLQTDDAGRVVAAARIERWDGSNDQVVYAPTATATTEEVREARHG